MAAVDSGVETENESFNEDSSNSLPPTPKVEDEPALLGVSLIQHSIICHKSQPNYYNRSSRRHFLWADSQHPR